MYSNPNSEIMDGNGKGVTVKVNKKNISQESIAFEDYQNFKKRSVITLTNNIQNKNYNKNYSFKNYLKDNKTKENYLKINLPANTAEKNLPEDTAEKSTV